ncbi:MAG: hypothetical protein ACI81V_001170 [Lentimonas sp.]|jgi:hypothetical protein
MPHSLLDPAVHLIHFNRPDSARRQIEALKSVAAKRVWLLCDGPRADQAGEEEQVSQVRALLDNLPWTCEVRTLSRGTNLGCFSSVSKGTVVILQYSAAPACPAVSSIANFGNYADPGGFIPFSGKKPLDKIRLYN